MSGAHDNYRAGSHDLPARSPRFWDAKPRSEVPSVLSDFATAPLYQSRATACRARSASMRRGPGARSSPASADRASAA